MRTNWRWRSQVRPWRMTWYKVRRHETGSGYFDQTSCSGHGQLHAALYFKMPFIMKHPQDSIEKLSRALSAGHKRAGVAGSEQFNGVKAANPASPNNTALFIIFLHTNRRLYPIIRYCLSLYDDYACWGFSRCAITSLSGNTSAYFACMSLSDCL